MKAVRDVLLVWSSRDGDVIGPRVEYPTTHPGVTEDEVGRLRLEFVAHYRFPATSYPPRQSQTGLTRSQQADLKWQWHADHKAVWNDLRDRLAADQLLDGTAELNQDRHDLMLAAFAEFVARRTGGRVSRSEVVFVPFPHDGR